MGIPHQDMNCKLIILSIYFIFTAVFWSSNAQAYDSIFVVEGVEVDVTAENSVTAQDKAFEKAQVQAFEILSKRMVDDAQATSLPMPDSLTISSFIQDYEITSEQLSAVRYIGTYTFRFREKAVSDYFSVSGVSYTNTSSNTLLVLPIFQKHGKNTVWSEDNIWLTRWSNENLSGGLVPVEVPIGDLADIADIDDNNALSYNRRNLDRMLGRYGASEAAVMIAVPDMTLLSVTSGSDTAKGRLRISIYRTDRATAEHVQDIELQANGSETRDKLYSRAVLQSYAVLQKDWKNKTLASAADTQNYYVRVSFRTAKQWSTIRQALLTTSGLRSFQIMSLKKNEAVLSFSYRGDAYHLRNALRGDALILGDPYQYNEGSMIYDLKYGYKKQGQKTFTNPQSVEPAAGEEVNGVHTF
ncbi:MAG: DUF2066 domain-containing protein [Alphaproteobacteria bacterium]